VIFKIISHHALRHREHRFVSFLQLKHIQNNVKDDIMHDAKWF